MVKKTYTNIFGTEQAKEWDPLLLLDIFVSLICH
jgi:hypothetical protein